MWEEREPLAVNRRSAAAKHYGCTLESARRHYSLQTVSANSSKTRSSSSRMQLITSHILSATISTVCNRDQLGDSKGGRGPSSQSYGLNQPSRSTQRTANFPLNSAALNVQYFIRKRRRDHIKAVLDHLHCHCMAAMQSEDGLSSRSSSHVFKSLASCTGLLDCRLIFWSLRSADSRICIVGLPQTFNRICC